LAIDCYKEKGNSLLSYSLFLYALASNIVIIFFTFYLGLSLLTELKPILGFDTKYILIIYPIFLFLVIIALIRFYFLKKNKSKR
jgi:hypothetical protein